MSHLLRGLAANPSLPPELVDRLIALVVSATAADPDDDPSADLAYELSERADLTRAQVLALAAHDEYAALRLARGGLLTAADVDPVARPRVALVLLDERAGPARWARLLAAHPDREVRWTLASAPGLPLDVARSLAADPDIGVVAELALWTDAPEVIGRLAAHPHAEVRRKAAYNEATPPAALAALITGEGLAPAEACRVCDREEVPFTHDPLCAAVDCELFGDEACAGGHESTVRDMLHTAAGNRATPPGAAALLAGHPSMTIRRTLAERADLPPSLYARLAEDTEPGVRQAVVANPAVDEPLIRALAAADDPDLDRSALARHPRVPLDVLAHLARTVRIRPGPLPRIEAASPEELAGLAASPHAGVRMLAARRRDLPAEVRDALAADPDASVLKTIAPHPGIAEDRLRAMVARHGVRVLVKVASNPDASAALLADLARHDPPVRRAFREIAAHPNATAQALLPCLAVEETRARAAGHPALPPPVLVDLLTAEDHAAAEAAAANPALPRPVMEELIALRV
ncbi:hypothetical protein ACFWBF_22430 [Streptomyces sp. NPDC060028]|uniref:hypothetical protein n=1 Tax=Streptomyces sp. NPDC060028 TaxID=3347041 RepID=UPI003694D7DA